METPHERFGKVAKIFAVVHVIAFMIIIWLPFLQMRLRLWKESESAEKRILASAPNLEQLSLRELNAFKMKYEKYFNDNFGFRNDLVRWNSLFQLRVLGTSSDPRVILGKEGWLYFDYCSRLTAPTAFTQGQVETVKGNLRKWKAYFQSRDIPFLIVIVPDKPLVYPDYLPSHIRVRDLYARSNQMDRLLEQTGIDHVNLLGKLTAAKRSSDFPLYWLTDTHWNECGAFVGYEEIIAKIAKMNIPVPAFSPDEMKIAEKKTDGPGDLAGFLNVRALCRTSASVVVPRADTLRRWSAENSSINRKTTKKTLSSRKRTGAIAGKW